MANEHYLEIVKILEKKVTDKRHATAERYIMNEAANAIRELIHQRERLSNTQETYIKMCLSMEQPLDRMVIDAAALRECAVRNVNWADVETVSKFTEKVAALSKELHKYLETKIKDVEEVS